MNLASVIDDATGRAWCNAQWARQEWAEERIEEAQWEALAVLLANPAWAKGIPASLFASDMSPEFILVFRRVASTGLGGEELLESLCRSHLVTDDELLCIWDMLGYAFASYANAGLRLADALSRLRKIIAWQYRQERAKAVAQ